MPDDTTTPGQEPANTTTSAAGTEPSGGSRSIDAFPEEAQDYIRRLRQENAKHRNDLKDRDTRLREFEDRDKTDQQRATEAATTAESRATAAELKLARYDVAAELDLPLKYASRLNGTTKEELTADAKQLMKDLGLSEGEAGGSGFGGGVRRPVTRPKTMNQLVRQAAGH